MRSRKHSETQNFLVNSEKRNAFCSKCNIKPLTLSTRNIEYHFNYKSSVWLSEGPERNQGNAFFGNRHKDIYNYLDIRI